MATLPNPLPRLAGDPSGRTLGLKLPAGRLIDATQDGPWHEPLAWYGEERPAPGAWAATGPARALGLLPVLLDVGGPQKGPGDWELMPGEMSYAGDHDADEVLADFWERYAADELDGDKDYASREVVESLFGTPDPYDAVVAPYGATWPGLAAATPLEADPDARATEIAEALADRGSWLKEPRLALVPARRSADIPAALGWSGPLNHENDVARLCAVLRSWEDRFGIRVVALTFDQVVVSVAAPPATLAEAEAVAAEHFAFCPDNITQGSHTALRTYAEQEVLNEPVWSFWWD
ncbi:DUF4253 domain-containing protein [Streptomyces sp. NPDC048508]|uniref:DUF4253 domain-containing protein n=1 Tax=Streptomyces sp. NPDC048508 TaxID=3365561 RepID=UPI003712213C